MEPLEQRVKTDLPPWLHGWRANVLLALLVLSAYAGRGPTEFVFDDPTAIQRNPVVNGTLPLLDVGKRDFWGQTGNSTVGTYRPVVVTSFAIDWRVGHGSPSFFRWANISWHLAVVLLMFAVWRRLVGARTALAAAALVSVLAASSEAVLYGVGRADIFLALGATFGLLGFRTPGWRGALAAAAGFLFALGSKETGIVVPAVWIAIDQVLPTTVSLRARLARLAGFAVAAIPYFIGRVHALGELLPTHMMSPIHNPLLGTDRASRLFGAAEVFASRYLAGLADPWRRIPDCSATACGPSDASNPIAWLGLAIAAALLIAPILLRRRSPHAAAGVAWFALLFLPISNFIVLGPTIYGERLLYVPAIGLSVAIAVAANSLALRVPRAAVVWAGLSGVAALNLLAVRASQTTWNSGDGFIQASLRATPNNALTLCNVAVAANNRKDYAAAERAARQSLALYEPHMLTHRELASALFASGRIEEAGASFARAYELGRDATLVHDYASYLGRSGQYERGLQIIDFYARTHEANHELKALREKLARALARSRATPPTASAP